MTDAQLPRPTPRDTTGDEESDVSGGSTGARGRGSKRPRAGAARTASAGRAPRSHVATEQRRRDRINDGFDQLRDLIPHKDKLDKAAFLQKTIDYICQLQGTLQQLLDMGVVSSLSEDLQWTVRMLLPRQAPGGRPVGMRPDGHPPSSLFGPPTCSNVSGGGGALSGSLPPQQPQRQMLAAPQQPPPAAPQPQPQQQDPVQAQYLQSLLASMSPTQLHTLFSNAMGQQAQQQQPQQHSQMPAQQPQQHMQQPPQQQHQQPVAPEPARPVATPWMNSLVASAAPTGPPADVANFQQLAAWISATQQQQQQTNSSQHAQQATPPQHQAASQVSGESGGNTTLPSWNHLTQIAQALQQQGSQRQGSGVPSPLGFIRPGSNA